MVAGQQVLLGVPIPLSIIVCRRCRFIFQPELFSDALLTALYEKDTSFSFGEAEEELPIVQSYLVERQAIISRAMSTHDIAAGAAVLDVGGGRGECCQHLVPRHRVVVADTTECPPVDPRIEKVLGFFSSGMDEGTFDVVVMNHILEHVFSPTAFLATAHKILKVGGILIAEVPFELYTPLVARHLGDWRHVAYFCRATFRQFLEKSGFTVGRIVLEEGCYSVRRLPVIRTVARKQTESPGGRSLRIPLLALAADMLAPAALMSQAKRMVTSG